MAGTSPPLKAGKPRAGGLRALGEAVDRLTAPLIGRQRLLAADLAIAWARIAGDRLAATTHPDRLVFPPKRRNDGTLHLRAASGAAALELQHDSRRLIDRINAHLGYVAIARLKVVQAPLPPRATLGDRRLVAAAAAPEPGDVAETEVIDAAGLSGIDDERLRRALARLGRRVLADERKAPRDAAAGDACSDDGKPL
jgi:hypothetical protein